VTSEALESSSGAQQDAVKPSPPEAEPDYRFTLADERTMLAWFRTALALVAAGVAIQTFALNLPPQWLPDVIGVVAVVLGAVTGYVN
jgi:putative membrane protein